jgi:nitrous oxide reductase accessory protein NosL
MTRRLLAMGISIILVVLSLTPALATEIKCSECGMTVKMDSKFTSKITRGDTILYFCDIGDLFSYLKKINMNKTSIEVKDYMTGEWIDARKAYYVSSGDKFKTPMGWGIAAFKDKNEASQAGNIMDFDGTANALMK